MVLIGMLLCGVVELGEQLRYYDIQQSVEQLFVEGVALEKLKQGDHAPSVPVLSEGGHQELWRVAEELAEGAPGQVSLLPR
jgi:hypothetical protein